jgi:electron transfer flavoprotein beta subunit
MAAKKKEIRRVPAPAGAAAMQEILSLYAPQKAKQTQMIGGSPADAARELVAKLRDESRVIP